MSALLDFATVLLVSGGTIFFLAGTVGLLRFPDSLTRLHALGMLAGLKLVAVWLLAQLASAGATRLVACAVQRPS